MFGIKRRSAVAGLAVAPAALLGMKVRQPPQTAKYPGDTIGMEVARVAEPPGLKGYYAASRQFYDGRNYLRLLSEARDHHSRMNLNIMALRSVSEQHRYHMMVTRHLRLEEEQRTFFDRITDAFGVREWFERNGVAEAGGSSMRL